MRIHITLKSSHPRVSSLALVGWLVAICSDYDSGSPIIVPSKNFRRRGSSPPDLLVAMISWGEWCADPDFPAVNVRVSHASSWIDAAVCNMSISPPADFGCYSGGISAVSSGFGVFALLFLVIACVTCTLLACQPKRRRHSKSTIITGKKLYTDDSPSAYETETLVRRDTENSDTSYESIVGVEVTCCTATNDDSSN